MTATIADGNLLLAGIIEHPEDDDRRLIYADWLEEDGQDDRAEFIRVQVELAGLGDECPDRQTLDVTNTEIEQSIIGVNCGRCRWCVLAMRDSGLLLVNQEQWIGKATLLGLVDVGESISERITFRRGFVESVRCAWGSWQRHGRAVALAHPVERVDLTDMEPLTNAEGSGGNEWRYWSWCSAAVMVGDSHTVPDNVFALLDGRKCGRNEWCDYDSEEAALTDLSRVLILLARREP